MEGVADSLVRRMSALMVGGWRVENGLVIILIILYSVLFYIYISPIETSVLVILLMYRDMLSIIVFYIGVFCITISSQGRVSVSIWVF